MPDQSVAEVAREREALQELVGTEGWRIFLSRIEREWTGRGYQIRIGSALESTDPSRVKVMHHTSLEIKRQIQWPYDRLEELKGHAE